MNLITELNDMMFEMYERGDINGTDLNNVADFLNISRFTVYQYAKGNGKSISTAESIYSAFKDIVDKRKKLIEKQEILNDYVG